MMVFCSETLGALKALIESVDPCLGIRFEPAEGFQPVGREQPCDFDFVDKEWVDQHGHGMAGDEFYGTVPWRLGNYYVVAIYST